MGGEAGNQGTEERVRGMGNERHGRPGGRGENLVNEVGCCSESLCPLAMAGGRAEIGPADLLQSGHPIPAPAGSPLVSPLQSLSHSGGVKYPQRPVTERFLGRRNA